jgi:hypothetical protein
MTSPGRIFSDVPWLTRADLQIFGAPPWARLDELASAWLGQRCLVLPSVRVGLCWALEQRAYRRHSDHILVPRFMGRCILNSLGRFALPVESPTDQTRIALVVDQFGRRQATGTLGPQLAERNWAYIEDSPYGVGTDERPGEGSLGRFIGLCKVLPVVQGALFIAGDEALSQCIRSNRENSSAWGWPVWLTMLLLRKRYATGYSDAADAAYELYPAARGGSAALRGNLAAVFRKIELFEQESQGRMAAVIDALGQHVLPPDQRRLGYLVPFLPGTDLESAQAIFRKCGFCDAVLHVDLNRNMLEPNYVKSLVIPINPCIQRQSFELLVSGLKALTDLMQTSAENRI